MRAPFRLFVISLCLLSVDAVARGPIQMKNSSNGKSKQQNCTCSTNCGIIYCKSTFTSERENFTRFSRASS